MDKMLAPRFGDAGMRTLAAGLLLTGYSGQVCSSMVPLD